MVLHDRSRVARLGVFAPEALATSRVLGEDRSREVGLGVLAPEGRATGRVLGGGPVACELEGVFATRSQ